VLAALDGERVSAIADRLHITAATVYLWLHRFNDGGLAGLADKPRGGRPPTYTREEVGVVVATALTDPQTLGLTFASWTLDRLAAYLAEEKGIAMKRSRIDELLIAEGLRWRKEETWFGERVDPDFAEKRGPSNSSTPPLRREASSSVSTRWVRRRRRASRATSSSM
jgi:transposase